MKKFLQFIWALIGPTIMLLFLVVISILGFFWVFTLFGLFVLLDPIGFPSPLWVRWVIGLFDSFCAIMLLYGAIAKAYDEVYKN